MDLFKILLYTHIACGGSSLLLGTAVLVLKKGNPLHKLLGNLFYYMMLLAAVVALPMSYLHSSYFLFIIGVFTIYMLLSGKRYMVNKGKTYWQDWALTITMLVFAFAFFGLAIYEFVQGYMFGMVLLLFGCVSLLFVHHDWTNYTGRSVVANYYLTTHLQRMTGAYVASLTAFVVVNNQSLPGVLAWLLPGSLITPLIVRWTRKFRIYAGTKPGSTGS